MQKVNWQRTYYILMSTICVGIILWGAWSLLSQFVYAILLLVLSLAVAFLLTPPVNMLEKQHVPRIVASILVYIAVLGILGALGYALVSSLINQAQYFSNNLPDYILQLPTTYATIQKWLVDQGIPQANLNNALSQIQQQLQNAANVVISNILNIVFFVTDTIVNILVVVVLSFYFTLDGKRIRDNIVGIFPEKWLPTVNLFEQALGREVGNYIRGQLALATIIGVLAGGGCAVLGLSNFSLIIGVLAFLFETVPMVGPTLASAPAILISLMLPDPVPRTFYICGYFVLIQALEGTVFAPRILGKAVGMHPIVSILTFMVGLRLFGAFGALLATPVVAALWVVVASLYRSVRGKTGDQLPPRKHIPSISQRPTQNQWKGKSSDKVGNEVRPEHAREPRIRTQGLPSTRWSGRRIVSTSKR
jgi:predicted PurR-regulated permease PerM